jgi:hypothetical protein
VPFPKYFSSTPQGSAESDELARGCVPLIGLAIIVLAAAVLAVTIAAAAVISTQRAERCERQGGVYSRDAGCVQPFPTTTTSPGRVVP